jgi:hypothetical protein
MIYKILHKKLNIEQHELHHSQLHPQVIKFTSCLSMVGGSLRVLQLLPPLKLVAIIKLKYFWKWRKNTINLIESNPLKLRLLRITSFWYFENFDTIKIFIIYSVFHVQKVQLMYNTLFFLLQRCELSAPLLVIYNARREHTLVLLIGLYELLGNPTI